MQKYQIKKNDKVKIDVDILNEWKDWTFSEFICFAEFIKGLSEPTLNWFKSVYDKSIATDFSAVDFIKISYDYKKILQAWTKLNDAEILSLNDSDIYSIVNSNMLKFINLIMFPWFLKKADYISFKAEEDFSHEKYKNICGQRIPVPAAEILTLSQAFDFEIAITEQFGKETDIINEVKTGKFELLPRLAAIYQVQPFDDEKVDLQTLKNENATMQELLSYFFSMSSVIYSLSLDVTRCSITKVEKEVTTSQPAE